MSLKGHHTDWYRGSFNADLEYLLKVAENNLLRLNPTDPSYLDIYTDPRPVIGYGYDLEANKEHSVADLTDVGVTLSNAQKVALESITATSGIPLELQGLALPSELAATDLLWKAINDSPDGVTASRMTSFSNFLSNNNIELPDSRERAVLFSMWYQKPGKAGDGGYFIKKSGEITNMTKALIDCNRAEVWYEIRYGSAKVKLNSNNVLEALDGHGGIIGDRPLLIN